MQNMQYGLKNINKVVKKMGNNRLGAQARVGLQKNFSKAIRGAVKPGILSSNELNDAVDNMKQAIYASLYDSIIMDDDKVRHQYCPNNSWCLYKRNLPFINKPHHLNKTFLPLIEPVYMSITLKYPCSND